MSITLGDCHLSKVDEMQKKNVVKYLLKNKNAVDELVVSFDRFGKACAQTVIIRAYIELSDVSQYEEIQREIYKEQDAIKKQ